ncbi:MAG: ABC transporter permease [Thermotogae bacterium]|nr:MAG: ABC transporter permease [Thermotogota bacterium]
MSQNVEILQKKRTRIGIFKFRESILTIVIIGLGGVLSLLTPYFLTSSNISAVLIGLSAEGLVTIGMVMVMIAGEIDLSVGGIMALSSVVAGALFLSGVNIWLSAVVGFVLGALSGFVNGWLVGTRKINSFIITLAMMGMTRGIAYILTQGSPLAIGGVPKLFESFGGGDILGIPIFALIFLSCAVVGEFCLRKVKPFREFYFVGSNVTSARLTGIDVGKTKMRVFILSAMLASLAGILTLSRFLVATPITGTGVELRAIAAAVIGGTSFSGGEGTILGAVLGVLIVNLINNALILLNVSVYWQSFVNGLLLLVVVLIDNFTQKRSQ